MNKKLIKRFSKNVFIIFSLLFLQSFLAAQESNHLSSQKYAATGLYINAPVPVGNVRDFVISGAGAGLGVDYKLGIPILGLTAHFEYTNLISEREFMNHWHQFGFDTGIFADFSLGEIFSIQPEVTCGLLINDIDAQLLNINGTFFDFYAKGAIALRMKTGRIHIDFAPVYKAQIEIGSVINTVGLRCGVYLLGK